MGLHKSSHTAGAREVGLMGAMASCAPPNTLLIAAPTPRPCPAPTPLSTAATQTELTMVDLSKLESELVELKVEDEYRRFKQRGYARKSRGKKKVDECMRIWNEVKIDPTKAEAESMAEVEISKLKVEIRRLKQRGYERKYKAKLKAKNQKLKRMLTNANQEQAARKVENKKPTTKLAELEVENKRLKHNAYNRKWNAKNNRFKRMIANANQEQAARKVENKRPRTESSQPLARETAASRSAGIRSIIIQMN